MAVLKVARELIVAIVSVIENRVAPDIRTWNDVAVNVFTSKTKALLNCDANNEPNDAPASVCQSIIWDAVEVLENTKFPLLIFNPLFACVFPFVPESSTIKILFPFDLIIISPVPRASNVKFWSDAVDVTELVITAPVESELVDKSVVLILSASICCNPSKRG